MSHPPGQPSRAVRERLGHPVIDADGHFVEFTPALSAFLREEGVADLLSVFTRVGVGLGTPGIDAMSPEERARVRAVRAPWWVVPAENTLDLATAMLPELLFTRLDELGIDFAVMYPTAGLLFPHVRDERLRRSACRALNRYAAEAFGPCAERMPPAAVVPLHSPAEGIEELEHAVGELGLALLEGGVHWATALLGDLVARFEKRNAEAVRRYDPRRIDAALLARFEKHGARLAARARGAEGVTPFARGAGPFDDFAHLALERPEDVRDRFVPNFAFGCEADDPMVATAFERSRIPFGIPLRALFSSDIGHWDVPDMGEVLAEAYEQVDHGWLDAASFRDFVFGNAARFYTDTNPGFFRGTRVEKAVETELSR